MITDLTPFITQHLIYINIMDQFDINDRSQPRFGLKLVLHVLPLATAGRHYIVTDAAFLLPTRKQKFQSEGSEQLTVFHHFKCDSVTAKTPRL